MIYDMWYVTMTCDMWLATCDIWHIGLSYLALKIWERQCAEDFYTREKLLTLPINYGGVWKSTGPTPGLLFKFSKKSKKSERKDSQVEQP